jgi:hypothetical protein
MKNQDISKSDVYVVEASSEVYEEAGIPKENQKLFVVSIEKEVLKTPKGKTIATTNRQAANELAAEIDFSNELDVERISLYNMVCTQIDFSDDLGERFSFEAMTLLLLNDPVLRTCAGPEVVEQLKYFHTVENYLERFQLVYPSLPQRPFEDANDSYWVTDDLKRLVNHVLDESHDISESDRAIFITALHVFDSPILALLLMRDEITAHEFAVLYLTGMCINSKVWSDGNREEEISAKKEIAKDAECMIRYKRLFGKQLSEVEKLIQKGESKILEFKSTLRCNLHTKQNDSRIEQTALKTIAAFLNSEGGTLLVGVSDDGKYVGIEKDNFESEDKFQLHFKNLLKTKIGLAHSENIRWNLVQFDRGKVLKVDCMKGDRPVFLKTKEGKKFYIRTGPSTDELMAEELINYTSTHFSSKSSP